MSELLTSETVVIMPAETLAALRGSIKKWQAIVDGTGTDEGYRNCPLCALFNHDTNPEGPCVGCPVESRTELAGCDGSPYTEYVEAERLERKNFESPGYAKPFAVAELEFLVSLLPEGEAP